MKKQIEKKVIPYFLDKGRVAYKGTHESLLLESPEYKKLYSFQQV